MLFSIRSFGMSPNIIHSFGMSPSHQDSFKGQYNPKKAVKESKKVKQRNEASRFYNWTYVQKSIVRALYSHQHDLTLLGHVLPTVFFHKATGGTGFDYCVLDDLWNMEPMGGELPMGGQMGGSRKEVKTLENFLGENSALVNLDNLIGPSKPAVHGMPPSCKIGFRTGTVELIIYFICGQGTKSTLSAN